MHKAKALIQTKQNNTKQLLGLRNLGPTSVAWLTELGITTRQQLKAAGSIEVYRQLKARDYRVSLNLVYAIEGALLDLHWTGLPTELQRLLREQVQDCK